MSQMRTEIGDQAAVVARLASGDLQRYRQVCAAARSAGTRFVMYVGRGTSDNAAVYGQYLAGVLGGLPSGLALPSAVTAYRADLDLHHCLVIGISQSGQTPDVAESIAYANAHGALTVAITNELGSPVTQAAAMTLPTEAGVETALAATKTYTSQLAVLALLWGIWAGEAKIVESLQEQVPSAISAALDAEPVLTRLAESLDFADRILVVARGYNLATGLEAALKIQETAAVAALPYSAADLMHGPVAVVGRGLPALCLAASGKVQADLVRAARSLRDRQARVILVAPEPLAAEMAALPLTGGVGPGEIRCVPIADVPEPVSPLVAIVPAQLLACHLATSRGLDPDSPQGLSKVTLTR
jgi:glucosamine--fructose-6-phosphate aminotransferase (isomerizing)